MNYKNIILILILPFLLVFCQNKDDISPDSNSWISEIDSIISDDYSYVLETDSSDGYLAVGDNNILKINKEGKLINSTKVDFDYSFEDILQSDIRIYKNKIYRFSSIWRFDADPTIKVILNVYTDLGELLITKELDSGGIIYDVKIESENVFGMLIYDSNKRTMTLKRIHVENGVLNEIVLSTTGTSPRGLHISESGKYICFDSSNRDNLSFFDNNLNPKWYRSFSGILVHDVQFVENKGIYIAGSVASSSDNNFIALVSEDGEIIKRKDFVPYESNAWINNIKVGQKKIAVTEASPETKEKFRFSCFNFDLELESEIKLNGNSGTSNIVLNEIDGFTFMYGKKANPNDTETFPMTNPRFFKLGKNGKLPENYIYQ